MKLLYVVVLALVLATSTARAERLRWYRGFYTRIGVRDSYGMQEPFHAWAAFAFGIGYRYDRERWGIDASALNLQYDKEEGLHTAVRIVPYASLTRWTKAETWAGAGLSIGWLKGTVDQAIPKRKGDGLQAELIAGGELPREMRVRLFVQSTLTLPLYQLYDTNHSRDSTVYVYAFEIALGVRF
ncbi:MAG TPA: hypothetical protein VMZ53_27190 [Kofleriaceae bacterium]|nr:hypothetical protein [Kofleriaceae bacterium]